MTKFFTFLIIIVAVLAWCPWLKANDVLSMVDAKVVQLQEQTTNLCAIKEDRNSIKKVPFGYTENVLYDCTVNDPENGTLKSTDVVFVSFYKGIFGPPVRTFQ